MNQTLYTLAELPFRLEEHGFKNGNVYILKQAIRRRLNLIDPQWRQTEPRLVIRTDGVVTMTGSIIVEGAERFGVGIGIVRRERKVKNKETGKEEIFELVGYDLALAEAMAFKTAATDVLPRAAFEFGIGWYLKLDRAKGISNPLALQAFLDFLADKSAEHLLREQSKERPLVDPRPRPPRVDIDENGEEVVISDSQERPAHVDPATGEVQRQPEWYTRNREAFVDSLHKGLGGARETTEQRALDLLGLPDWSGFGTGKQAADAVAAAMQPAQPKANADEERPGEDDAPDDPVVTACDAYGMDGAAMLKLLGKESWSSFKDDAQAVAAIHNAALAQQLPFIVGALHYDEWGKSGGAYVDFAAPGQIGTIRMGGGRTKINGLIGVYGKVFAETYDLQHWARGNDYHVEGLRVSWKTSTDAKGKSFKEVIGLSWSPAAMPTSQDLFDSIPSINDQEATPEEALAPA